MNASGNVLRLAPQFPEMSWQVIQRIFFLGQCLWLRRVFKGYIKLFKRNSFDIYFWRVSHCCVSLLEVMGCYVTSKYLFLSGANARNEKYLFCSCLQSGLGATELLWEPSHLFRGGPSHGQTPPCLMLMWISTSDGPSCFQGGPYPIDNVLKTILAVIKYFSQKWVHSAYTLFPCLKFLNSWRCYLCCES